LEIFAPPPQPVKNNEAVNTSRPAVFITHDFFCISNTSINEKSKSDKRFVYRLSDFDVYMKIFVPV
jgi:hypothetical protein